MHRAYFRLVLPQAELLEPNAWHSSQKLAIQLDGLISYKIDDKYKIQVDVQKPPSLYSYLEYQQCIYIYVSIGITNKTVPHGADPYHRNY